MRDQRTAHWEHYEHGADIGIHGMGGTQAIAFAQAALALTAVTTHPDNVSPVTQVKIECEAPDVELLFVEWLNALIYEMAVKNMLFSRFDVILNLPNLHAMVWGEKINLQKHHPAVEVKGATYTTLGVYEDDNATWHARTVVDV